MTRTLDVSALPEVASLHPELAPEERWFAAHMYARERAYDAVFGTSEPDGQILSPADPSLAVNWPGGGVFQYAPDRGRSGWHYVTHGLAQPDSPEDAAAAAAEPEGGSGCGIELVISTPAKCNWAPHVVFNLVRYMLFQKGARLILPGDRVPCNGPIVLGSDTQIRNVIAVVSPEYASRFWLPAGVCQLVHLVGVTDPETARAKAWGTGRGGTYILAEVLRTAGIGCVTNPERPCLTSTPEFESMWQSAKAKLESEWAVADASGNDGA